MVISVKELFARVGEKKTVEFEIPREALSELRGYHFATGISVSGLLENRAGILTFSYHAAFSLAIECDRCLKPFERAYDYDFSHSIVQSLNTDNDEYIVAEDATIHADEIAITDLLLRLPTKLLCREDCKGLCMSCGHDLNESDCACQDLNQ